MIQNGKKTIPKMDFLLVSLTFYFRLITNEAVPILVNFSFSILLGSPLFFSINFFSFLSHTILFHHNVFGVYFLSFFLKFSSGIGVMMLFVRLFSFVIYYIQVLIMKSYIFYIACRFFSRCSNSAERLHNSGCTWMVYLDAIIFCWPS